MQQCYVGWQSDSRSTVYGFICTSWLFPRLVSSSEIWRCGEVELRLNSSLSAGSISPPAGQVEAVLLTIITYNLASILGLILRLEFSCVLSGKTRKVYIHDIYIQTLQLHAPWNVCYLWFSWSVWCHVLWTIATHILIIAQVQGRAVA